MYYYGKQKSNQGYKRLILPKNAVFKAYVEVNCFRVLQENSFIAAYAGGNGFFIALLEILLWQTKIKRGNAPIKYSRW